MNRLYTFGRFTCSRLVRFLAGKLRIEGVENIPEEGPFLLMPNHQSALDPPLVHSFCPRDVHAMAKSTQFSGPVFRWLLPRILAFPVRRYRVDPQAVRMTLRLLEQGEAVSIYPEGERTWDGTLQPLRRGAVRLAQASGVPIIPCGVQGMYDVWPRWSRRPRRGFPVTLRYGPPIRFGPYASREERDADLPEAYQTLWNALLELSGEATGAEQPFGQGESVALGGRSDPPAPASGGKGP